jgi:hypothetical protein
MATFCKAFSTAQIRFFNQDQLAQAREWVKDS